VVGVLQVVSEKSVPVNGAAGTGDSPGPPQLEEPATFVNLSDIGIVVVVVGAAVVVVGAAVVVVGAAVVVVGAAVVVVTAAVVVVAAAVVVVAAAVVVVAAAVVVVAAAVVVVTAAVVVVAVVPPGHVGPLPGNGQASQQLPHTPTVPPFAVQASALFLLLQLVTPFLFVMQQVTNPGLPHTDFAAHFFTAPLHDFGSMLLVTAVLADCATQLTYAPWSAALAHGPHACSAAARGGGHRAAWIVRGAIRRRQPRAGEEQRERQGNTSGDLHRGPPSFSERFVQGDFTLTRTLE
jgi:hypothetical protein